MFENIISKANEIVWNPALVGLLIVAGLYFSLRTRLVQVRRFGLMLKSLFGGKSFSSLLPGCWCTVTHVVVQSLSHV